MQLFSDKISIEEFSLAINGYNLRGWWDFFQEQNISSIRFGIAREDDKGKEAEEELGLLMEAERLFTEKYKDLG